MIYKIIRKNKKIRNIDRIFKMKESSCIITFSKVNML